MLFYNFISSLRLLTREKLYTIINAVGLALGFTICFLISAWIYFEYSYDKHIPDHDRIYRVATQWDQSKPGEGIASTFPMVRTRVLNQLPEIEESVRVFDAGFLGGKTRITVNNEVFINNRFYYADSTFLRVFPFQMINGNPSTALDKPNAVILTRTTALKFFGSLDIIGKTIKMGSNKELEVTGIIEDIPLNTHFNFDLIASMASHPWIKNAEDNVWSGIVFHTYLKLRKNQLPEATKEKIAEILDHFPNDPEHLGKSLDLKLQPITDIHLKSHLQFELLANGNISNIYLFGTIATLVLFLAIVNYINLATARNTQRFKEVGVRKVIGATRKQLIAQFMTESILETGGAFLLTVVLIEVAGPLVFIITGSSFLSPGSFQGNAYFLLFLLAMLVGILSGLAPALLLATFKPVNLFKSNLGRTAQGITLRKVLVIFQFSVSILLTIATAITYSQMNFLKKANLGYDLDHTLVLNIGFEEVKKKYELFKNELKVNPSIVGATATSQLPTNVLTGENIDVSNSGIYFVNSISVDPDFFEVMNIPIKQGKELIASIEPSDSVNYFVLNETALKHMGWKKEDVLNRKISIRHGNQVPGPIMGVSGDFHFKSLHFPLEPLVLEFSPSDFQYLLIRVKPTQLENTINFIKEKWKLISEKIPLDYFFLDSEYDKLYNNERRTENLFIIFSTMALLIALLGLFGLSSFSIARRTKEIGIRKALGADFFRILRLLFWDYFLLICIAFCLAFPLGYFFKVTWLARFAFQVNIPLLLFIGAGLINLILAFLTISYHSITASRTNPVEALRYE